MHPSSCNDPACQLTYREHLIGIGISPAATPSRSVTRTPGLPDEPCTATRAREKRWAKDHAAYKTLRQQGYNPPSFNGAHWRAQTATTDAEVNG